MRKLSLASLFLLMTLGTSVHTAELKESFSYGINYAWKNYSADFGGLAAWGMNGVAGDTATYQAEFDDMAANGIEVVRWWIFPEFWNDSITFDANGAPNPLGQQAKDDVQAALEIASNSGIRVMFCIFSFDGFRPTRELYGITMTGIHDIVTDNSKRAALMSNIVRPLITAAAESPHVSALHSWDVINEPEWAITGANKYGNDAFAADHELEPISHDQMEVFIGDTIKVMRSVTPDIPVTIGNAAIKWMSAWNNSDIDFYQPHIYDWVNDYWPYSRSPAELGFNDKPMIMGEYPVEGLDDADHKTMLQSWFNNGYAGALGWDYRVTHSKGESDAVVASTRSGYLQEFKEFASSNDIGTPAIGAANPAPASEQPSKKAGSLSKPGTPAIEIDQ